MAQYVKLQPLKQTNSTGAQDITEAVDAGSFRDATVVLNVTQFVPATAKLKIETAAENSEEKYAALGPPMEFTLTGTTTACKHSYQFARFLRWNLTSISGSGNITFEVDVVLKTPA